MDFATVSSGISAETVAWEPLGWTCRWHSEIDPFCNSVLKYHFPGIPNRGDMLTLKRGKDERSIGLIAGGTPCQGFSIAGKRGGMDDDRSKLSLRFLEILSEFDADWCVWENVFGVLSSNDGRDFGTFLAGLAKRGYGYAWRVLDAQYFGVPQRRRRVFVIGYRGNDWRPPAAVLFDATSLSGYSPQSGKTWTDIAGTLGSCSEKGGSFRTTDLDGSGVFIAGPVSDPYDRGDGLDPLVSGAVTPGADAISQRDGQNTLIVGALGNNDKAAGTMTVQNLELGQYQSDGTFVRRLMPVECERLQGFPDNFTRIPWRNKPAEKCPDSHRYKALGNSMAIPVVRRIGERIEKVDKLLKVAQ